MPFSDTAILAAYAILLAALGAQVVVAVLAFRLISQLGWNRGWTLLATAFVLQVSRRILALGRVTPPVSDLLLFEYIVVLLISAFMLWGVVTLRPIFLASQQAHETLRENAVQSRQMVEALNESQRQLNTLLSNLSGMAYRCPNERGWPMEFISEGSFALTGYHPDDLVGNRTVAYGDLIHPEDREMVWNTIQTAIAKQQPFQITYRLRTADGGQKWVWEQGVGVRNVQDEVTMLEGLVVDITHLEESRRALEQSESRYRMLAENLTDVIWVVGLDGRFTYVSPSVRQLRGYDPEEIIGRPMEALLTPEGRQQVAEAWAGFQRLIHEGIPYDGPSRFEIQQPFKHGGLIWTEELVSLFTDQDGAVVGLLGVSRDITDRRMMEGMLHEQISLNEKILDTMQDGYVLFDVQGRLLDVNDSYIALSGYSRRELLQMSIADLDADLTPEETKTRIAEIIAAETLRFETRHRHRDGHEIALEVSISALNWMDEPLMASFMRDITQRRQMEEQIARDHKMLRTLIDNLPDHIYVKDREGRFLIVNQVMVQAPHLDNPQALIGKTDYDVFSKELADFYAGPEKHLIATGEPVLNREEYYFTPEGKKHWLLTSKFPLRNDQGEIIGLVGMGRDVTAMKALLEAEHDQREWAETLRDTAVALSQITELDAVLDALLEQIERVVPHDGADIRLVENGISHLVRSRGYEDYGDRWVSIQLDLEIEAFHNLRTMVVTREPVLIADIHQDPHWVTLAKEEPMHSYLGVPIIWEDAVIGFIHVLSKTPGQYTELHAERMQVFAAEAAVAIQKARLFEQVQAYATRLEALVSERTSALRASEARYRAIVEDQLEMVIRYTPDGALTFANEAYCQFAGVTFEALQGSIILNLPLFRDRSDFSRYLQGLTPEQPVGVVEQSYATEEGEAWIQWTDRVIAAEQGGTLEYQSVGRDITRLKLMEQQLRHALEREISVGEMRSRFLSMAAHDLRNPLAAIKTTVDLLIRYHDRLSEEKKAARLASADQSIRTMVGMLDDILTIGRVESGRLEFEPELLALEPFCWRLADEITAATGAYNVIRVQCAVPKRDLFLDERLLRHILSNLLSNAVKYSPDHTPVDFRVEFQDGAIVFEVQDYGIGIPEDEQYLVFEFFRRFSNVGSIPGTGLGLTIVKRAVEIHGGTIAFESVEHVGTTFRVEIPVITPADLHYNATATLEIEPEQDD